MERAKLAIDLHEKIESKLLRLAELRAEANEKKKWDQPRSGIGVIKDEGLAFEKELAPLEGRTTQAVSRNSL